MHICSISWIAVMACAKGPANERKAYDKDHHARAVLRPRLFEPSRSNAHCGVTRPRRDKSLNRLDESEIRQGDRA